MSLRLRILAGLVGLLVLGLTAFGVGINALMRKHLEGQLNQQLVTVAGTVRQVLTTDQDQRNLDRLFDAPIPQKQDLLVPPVPLPPDVDVSGFPPGLVVQVRSQGGTLLDRQAFTLKQPAV